MKISCKIKFSDSFRFISTSLSSIVDVLSDGLHGYKCADCRSFLNYMIPKDDKLILLILLIKLILSVKGIVKKTLIRN